MQRRKGSEAEIPPPSGGRVPARDASDLVETTACPAFRADTEGTILAWNSAAEELFGRSVEEAVGQRCHDVVAGRDLFGNRFCHASCSVRNMARRGEPVHHFLMDVRHPSGATVRTGCCTLVERGSSDLRILHLFQPWDEDRASRAQARAVEASSADDPDSTDFLTPREREVLSLLDRGEPTREMAGELGISITTVRNHVQGILRKLGAHSRLEAVSIARRHGLL